MWPVKRTIPLNAFMDIGVLRSVAFFSFYFICQFITINFICIYDK